MKIKFQIILLLNILLATANYLNAKEYRGIVPFHSTREDVTRLLGKSPDENEIRANYYLEKERVYIGYFSGLKPIYHECIKQLPHDTVMVIEVTPTTSLQLSDLQIDEKRLRKFDPSYQNIGYEGFIDEEDGIVIRTLNGKIDQINYIPTMKDRHLCPTYYDEPERSVGILVHFPENTIERYATNNEIKQRLDKLYSQLITEPTKVGVIHNDGTDKEVTNRKVRIIKAIKSRKYDMNRIKFVRGSSEPGIRTRLFVVPAEDIPKP